MDVERMLNDWQLQLFLVHVAGSTSENTQAGYSNCTTRIELAQRPAAQTNINMLLR